MSSESSQGGRACGRRDRGGTGGSETMKVRDGWWDCETDEWHE